MGRNTRVTPHAGQASGIHAQGSPEIKLRGMAVPGHSNVLISAVVSRMNVVRIGDLTDVEECLRDT